MKAYKFVIITPQGQILDQDVVSLIAPSITGMFGVLADHAPMIVAIVPGVLEIIHERDEQFWAVDSGILEVHPERDVLMLLDDAQKCQTKDEAKLIAKKFEPVKSYG